ncbi:NAD-dependent epimerase/dehydratase family protein [Pseudarthrobacter sp. H3Y2-7]|uniref:NAD-dependent epimerase/dehydratase family protein n=1 Tax=Pseudarthrobacter naphthalenicus TaxID=3031328 RepID=UPI0023AF8F40|nr:NAD-dependent epimerase/dehydratase family protein [Pseudarthrobacter sp. H3Y2-7]MDE8669739.1 NAD-dependent epimerase/dehydratase family protein [Pseudarthrobacter sp. H3Y2-7]
MNDLHVVTGAGPVGWAVAEQLAEQGKHVRVLTRSGSGPEHSRVERRAVDVQDAARVREALSGAAAVFHCIHGSSYTADAWRAELPRAEQTVLAAAGEAGAVVVFPESLYSYSEPDRPMIEAGPRAARGGKLGVRTDLLRARDASPTNTVSVVAGDFFGPRVRNSHGGERMVAPVLAGKKLWVMGSADQPHSFTYVPDLAAAMIMSAQTPSLWNRVWHAPTGPAVTQRQLATAFAEAGGAAQPKIGAIPGWALRVMGLFSKDLGELGETLYQFQKPFVMDSAVSQAALGLHPTPLAEAAAATVAWWRNRG